MPTTPGALARRIPVKGYAAVVATLTLAVSALFGGLGAAPDTGPKPVVNKAIDAGPLTVTVIDARVLDSATGLEVTKPGDRWFAAVVVIDVTTDAAQDDLDQLVQVGGVTGVHNVHEADRFILARDGSDVGYLNPHMPERVAYCWEQAATAPIPATVTISIYGQTFRTNSLTGGQEWLPDGLVATVTAPVVDKRG